MRWRAFMVLQLTKCKCVVVFPCLPVRREMVTLGYLLDNLYISCSSICYTNHYWHDRLTDVMESTVWKKLGWFYLVNVVNTGQINTMNRPTRRGWTNIVEKRIAWQSLKLPNFFSRMKATDGPTNWWPKKRVNMRAKSKSLKGNKKTDKMGLVVKY